jgi:hypothetical protein
MRAVDMRAVPRAGAIVLLTVEDLVPNAEMMMADFRDTHAVYYLGLDGWVGLGPQGLAMGRGSPELVDGIWYVSPDEEKNSRHRNHEPDPGRMELRRIG